MHQCHQQVLKLYDDFWSAQCNESTDVVVGFDDFNSWSNIKIHKNKVYEIQGDELSIVNFPSLQEAGPSVKLEGFSGYTHSSFDVINENTIAIYDPEQTMVFTYDVRTGAQITSLSVGQHFDGLYTSLVCTRSTDQ